MKDQKTMFLKTVEAIVAEFFCNKKKNTNSLISFREKKTVSGPPRKEKQELKSCYKTIKTKSNFQAYLN